MAGFIRSYLSNFCPQKAKINFHTIGQMALYVIRSINGRDGRIDHADRTAGPAKASRFDWLGRYDWSYRHGRNSGHIEAGDRQDPQRDCGSGCTRKIYDARSKDGCRQESGCREVGVMLAAEVRDRQADYGQAERLANRLSEPYSVPPIPVLEIAENNGVNVIFHEFNKHKELIAGFCDFSTRRLYVNADDPLTRQAFTMAHELGHWMMHREYFVENPSEYPVLPRFQSPDRNNPYEQEANCFAANLLVPLHSDYDSLAVSG
jgi:IrrE N-terminal-like domain